MPEGSGYVVRNEKRKSPHDKITRVKNKRTQRWVLFIELKRDLI
jgi:hypothetical protein